MSGPLAFSGQVPRALVTGASGYLGRELCCQLLEQGWDVTAGVRDVAAPRARTLAALAEALGAQEGRFRLVTLDVTDEGAVHAALESARPSVVFHVACVFRKCRDPVGDMVEPNLAGAEAVVQACGRAEGSPAVVLTSSMAAVRHAKQEPRPGRTCYDHHDTNTVSSPEQGWGGAYQYSKAESESRARALAQQHGVRLVALCPSMILGPERAIGAGTEDEAAGFSVSMVRDWLRGRQPVRSLLIVDVRDVARAHVAAAQKIDSVQGERFIVSTESRVPPEDLAQDLRKLAASLVGAGAKARISAASPSSGGPIAEGEREVEAAARLSERLGVECREVRATVCDMARALAGKSSS